MTIALNFFTNHPISNALKSNENELKNTYWINSNRMVIGVPHNILVKVFQIHYNQMCQNYRQLKYKIPLSILCKLTY